jgi:acyl-CoA synthetase (NDP forming)
MTGDERATPASGSLNALFRPRSVAVIGASATPGKWGCTIMENILAAGFKGPVYPVNPKAGTMHGLDAYGSLRDVPDNVDLAIIGVPAAHVAAAVDDCVAKSVGAAVIVTAGFGEVGGDGTAMEKDVLRRARNGNLRLVGPNCLGLSSRAASLNASLLPYVPGTLGLISQSGNVTVELQLLAGRMGMGFSRFVSFGNQVDLQVHEYLEAMADDDETRVILIFAESIDNGRAFLERARRVTEHKPVLALKAGGTSAGGRAARSHTGALAGADEIYGAAFRQAGVARVDTVRDLIVTGAALSAFPDMKGNRVAVLTDGGGHGTVAADACVRASLDVVELDETTRARLQDALLPTSQTGNPVDFAGAADYDLWSYTRAAEIVLAHESVDALMIVGALFGGYGALFGQEELELEVAEALGRIAQRCGKPVVLHSPYEPETPPSVTVLRQCGIPVVADAEDAVRSLGIHAQWCEWRRATASTRTARTAPATPVTPPRPTGQVLQRACDSFLAEYDAVDLLTFAGFDVARGQLARSADEAIAAAEQIGWPVVLKICSPDILHKSDAGGVVTGIASADALRSAWKETTDRVTAAVPRARIDGLMVYEQLPSGVELAMGASRDEQFGPVVMCGVGGVFVETLRDVSWRVAPITVREAHAMIKELRGFPLLTGTRGTTPCDVDAIAALLVKVSELSVQAEWLSEMDLNPVIADENGVRVADVRMAVTQELLA